MIQRDYKFSYSVSTTVYDKNKDERQTAFLKWREKQGTVKDLVNDVKNGFAYCPTFNHKGATFVNAEKRDNNLKETYFITFDFDAVRLAAGEFYGCMIGTDLPPTLVYTTANDGIFKDGKNETYCNRYRAIYALDEPITTAEDYTTIHQALKAEIATTVGDNNIFNDNTDKSVSHFFAGCRDAVTFSNENVTPLAWLCERYGVTIATAEDAETCGDGCNDTEIDNAGASNTTNASNQDNADGGRVKTVHAVEYIKKGEALYNGMHKNDPFANVWDEFITDYRNPRNTFKRLRFLYRDRLPMLPTATDLTPYINETNKHKLYIDVDGDFTELVYRRIKVNKRDRNGEMVEHWENAKFFDGMGRRRKLFLHCLLLRHITPTATRVQLLWAAVNFIVDYVDCAKDLITKHQVTKIVDNVMSKDLADWQRLKQRYTKTFKVNKAVAAQREISSRQAALKAQNERATDRKTDKWEQIATYYDPTKTDKENIEILAANGVECKPTYLQRWKHENGFTKQGKRSRGGQIATYYDPNLTDGQNVEQLAANGVKVSLKTFKRWKKENGYTKPSTKAENKPNKADESVIIGLLEGTPSEQTKHCQGSNMDVLGCANIDVIGLANRFLHGGNPSTLKGNGNTNTMTKTQAVEFYKSHHLEGAKYVSATANDVDDDLQLMGWIVDDEQGQLTETNTTTETEDFELPF